MITIDYAAVDARVEHHISDPCDVTADTHLALAYIALQAKLRAAALVCEAADKLAQKSNAVTCTTRHEHNMSPALDGLYKWQLVTEECLRGWQALKDGQ